MESLSLGLYNNTGNYVVVYYKEDVDNWVYSDVHSGLFGTGNNPGAVIAYRETTWPVTPYSPAKDIHCSLVNLQFTNAMYMHWSSGDGSTMEMGLEPDKIYIKQATASDYNHLSFRHSWNMNKTRFFFGGDGADTYYTTDFKHFPGESDGWAGETNPSLTSASSWGVVNNPMRARHTRRAFVNALMNHVTDNSMSIRGGEMTEDNGIDPGLSDFASTDLYFNNLCSPGDDGLANENGAFDLEFEWGINQTTEDNCLFANIQAFGKYSMTSASFPPSHDTGSFENDTLLCLTVAPIIHGCRGISFYALDMALQCGPTSIGSAPLFRAPNTFLNWGPSRDCEENADIVSWVHDVVKMLTGKMGGPDFLNALVNHSDYTVLDETEAVNALIAGTGYIPFPDDEFLNFIALQEDNGGDILLLVSYDGAVDGYGAPLIVFPNEYACDYGPLECWGGWDPSLGSVTADNTTASAALNYSVAEYAAIETAAGNAPISQPRLGVYVEYMPARTVSLLRIPAGGKTDSVCDSAVQPGLHVRRSAGSVLLQLSGEFDNCDLSLYDIMGRKVEEIEIPETEGYEIQLNADSYRAGMYFVVLREEADVVQMEKISIF